MTKYLMLFVIMVLLLGIFTMAVPVPAHAELPAVCSLAGYGPQWMTQCLIQIAFALWIDPLTLL